MFWLIVGYLFLFIFRPYEYWPILGAFRIERVYMIFLMIAVFLSNGKRYRPHPVATSILFFFLAMIVSSIMALSWDAAYDKSFDYFKLIVFFFIITLTIRDEKDLKNFMIAYIAIMFLYIGKSAWEFFINDRHFYRMGIKRMIGIDVAYGDPNTFAASIAYSLPFVWAMIKCKFENPWIRKGLWVYAVLGLVCIVFTGSRSGMVTALLFFMLAWMGISKKLIGIVSIGIFLIFAWTAMPEKYQLRFMTIFVSGINESADGSAQGRIYTLQRGIDMFKKYPLVGVGPGNFPNGLKLFGDYSGLNAHNMYGLLLGETGLIGSLAFIFLIYSIIATHRKIIQKAKMFNNQFYEFISVASIQAIILLLFNGNFGGNLYRYNWLWIGAIGVLSSYFLSMEKDAGIEKKRIEPLRFLRGYNGEV